MTVFTAELASPQLRSARIRGVEAREGLLAFEGGTVSTATAAKMLGITPQAVQKRRQRGRLLGVGMGRHGYQYPLWQFTSHGVLAGLEEVLLSLREHDPWMQLAFFATGNGRLDGQTPVDALRCGDPDAVRHAATAFGEHGAD